MGTGDIVTDSLVRSLQKCEDEAKQASAMIEELEGALAERRDRLRQAREDGTQFRRALAARGLAY